MGALLSPDTYEDMGGSVENEEQYARLSRKAAQLIRRATLGRCELELTESAQTAVDGCCFELIELFTAESDLGGMAQGREIASMSNDGVSVSFAKSDNSSAGAVAQARAMGIIRQWLDAETTAAGTHLLYGGVDA